MLTESPSFSKQFILYRIAPSARPGKNDKLPCNMTGKVVNAQDPQYWMDAASALILAEMFGNGWGVGVVLTAAARIAVVDVDGCIDPQTGQLSDLALALIAMLPGAYVEVSISGTGIHIWFSYSGEIPAHSCRGAQGLEFYHCNRFIALGTPYEAPGFINGSMETDLTLSLPALVARYFPPDAHGGVTQEWTEGPCEGSFAAANPAWTDSELLSKAMGSNSAPSAFGANPASFRDLWEANAAKLGARWPAEGREYDCSAADAALAQRLAWWTGRDCSRIERIMRRPDCGLIRGKWDTHPTYLQRTVLGAVARQDSFYEDKRPPAGADAPGASLVPAAGGIELQGVEVSLLQLKTQDSVAQIFELKQAGKLLFNHSRGAWMEWEGTRWKIETTQKAFDFARDLARSVNWEGASSLGSASFCGGVEKFAQASRTFAVTGEQFDRDNYLLNTPAGTIDLRTGQMRPHDPADMITKCTAVSPDTESDGVEFRQLMLAITGGDKELIDFHQVSLGACLSGAIEDHYLLFWTGSGRNGKNTLGDLVKDLMGNYARKIESSALMAKKFENHPAEIAQLQGVRLAISSEINEGDFWHEARIKELTGDSTINARFMRENPFEFERTQKHLIYGNARPQLRAVGDAIKSRIKIVPFKVSFLGREDKDLPGRLRAERGYVLGWMIEGHRMWLAAGKRLPKCKAVEDESADYFASQSTPEMWLKERCEILTRGACPTQHLPKVSEMYRDYKRWKESRGEIATSQTRWSEAMREFDTVRSKHGLHYLSLRLLPLGAGDVPFPPSPETPSSDFVKFAGGLM